MTDIFGGISIDTDAPEKKTIQRSSPQKRPHKKNKSAAKKPFSSILSWLIIPIGLLTVYTLLGFLGVPYYVTHFIPEQLQLKYNLNLTADKISFNPYSFSLKLHNTKVTQQDGEPLIDVENIDLIFSPIELLRMEFICQKVQLSAPHLHLVRNKDNSYNISPLLPGSAKDRTNRQMMTFSDLPVLFSLNNITVTDGRVVFVDKPTDQIHNVEQLEMQLPTLSNIGFQAEDYIRPHFSAIINGSPVTFKDSESSSNPGTKASQTELTWELQDVKLEDYMSYLPFSLPLESSSGIIDGTIKLLFNNEIQQNNFSVGFKLGITKFYCNTSNKFIALDSDNIQIAGEYNPVKKRVLVDTFLMSAPTIVSNAASLDDVLSYFAEKKADDSAIPHTSQRQTSFIIRSLNIIDGKLKQGAANKSTPPKEWVHLRATIDNFNSHNRLEETNGMNAVFTLTGEQNNNNHSFSYSGTFGKPTELTGDFSMKKMSAKTLFRTVLPKGTSITDNGPTDVEGKLSLIWNSDDRKLNYRLSEIESYSKKITLSNNKTLLTADGLQLSGAAIGSNHNKLGKVTINQGHLYINRSRNVTFFTKLLTSEKIMSSLAFDGELTITSPDTKDPFTMRGVKLDFQAKGETNNSRNTLTLSGTSKSGGTVNGTGQMKFNPLAVDLTLNFDKLKSQETESLLTQPNFITKSDGTISGKGTLTFPQNNFVGNLTITDGKIVHKTIPLMWKSCAIENISFTSDPYHRTIGRILLQAPKLQATIQNKSDSIQDHLIDYFRASLAGTPGKVTQTTQVNLLGTDIQDIIITDGQIYITDTRLSPTWRGSFTGIKGSIKNIHSAKSAENATFSMSGDVDGSSFNWEASISPVKNGKLNSQQLSVENYPVKNYYKQLEAQIDVDSDSAMATFTSNAKQKSGINEQNIDAHISGLTPLSPTSETALPIALMADKNGVIHIQTSISTSVESTKLSLFETLANSFQTKVVKGSLSPLLLTKGDFADLIDNEHISFQPGLFMLTGQGRKTLTRYGALLVSHPNIKLIISGGISLDADRTSLHAQLEKDEKLRVERENEKLFAKWQEKKQEFENQVSDSENSAISEGKISENDIPSKVLSGFRPLLPEPVIVDDEMLYDLAEKRLSIVRNHLLTQLSLDESRIEIAPHTIDTRLDIKTSRGVHIDITPL
ncbi:DUF748 domain-containing protein [Desulforhopalus sp. 52FAK]